MMQGSAGRYGKGVGCREQRGKGAATLSLSRLAEQHSLHRLQPQNTFLPLLHKTAYLHRLELQTS